MDNLDKQALIEKYIHKNLTDEELNTLETLVKEDQEFSEELEVAVIVNAEYQVAQKKRWRAIQKEDTSNNQSSVLKSVKTPPQTSDNDTIRSIQPKKTNLFRKIAAIVLVLLVPIFAYFMFQQTNSLDSMIGEQMAMKHPVPTSVRGKGNTQKEWQTASLAYQKGKYDLTIAAIDRVEQMQPLTNEQHLYEGLSQAYKNPPNYQAAIESFDKILAAPDDQLRKEALWYSSLVQLKLNDPAKAKKHLSDFTQIKPQSWKYEQAVDLLKNL